LSGPDSRPDDRANPGDARRDDRLAGVGKATRDGYREVLEPALHEGIGSGELRLLFVLTDYDGLEAKAVPEDIETGLSAWFGHHSSWKPFALVTDADWVARAMHIFAWMVPGDLMIRDLDGLEEAKAWVAG
jgi:stage II sporulation SpoAA-like protein